MPRDDEPRYESYDPTGAEVPWELREEVASDDADELPWELREAEPEGLITDGTVNWSVVVEYAARSAFGRNQIGLSTRVVVLDDHDDRDAALKDARYQAFEFQPPHPLMPRLRQVFETADGYLVMVEGATETFAFTVRALKLAGVVDEMARGRR